MPLLPFLQSCALHAFPSFFSFPTHATLRSHAPCLCSCAVRAFFSLVVLTPTPWQVPFSLSCVPTFFHYPPSGTLHAPRLLHAMCMHILFCYPHLDTLPIPLHFSFINNARSSALFCLIQQRFSLSTDPFKQEVPPSLDNIDYHLPSRKNIAQHDLHQVHAHSEKHLIRG